MSTRIANPADHLPHLVERPPYPCPHCHQREPYKVYVAHVEWRCGHVEKIPALGERPAEPYGHYRKKGRS